MTETPTHTPLPCPFCGGEAAITSTSYGHPASHWVKCGNCGACSTNYSSRKSSLTAWNTRADSHHRLVEALEDAHKAIAEYYRYWTGGETRGSYDGKPERDGMWKAMYASRAALKEAGRG